MTTPDAADLAVTTEPTHGAGADHTVRSFGWRALIDRYPFNSVWVHGIVRTWIAWALPAWFAFNSFVMMFHLAQRPLSVGFDVRLYRLAAETWLAGGNPWQVTLPFDAAQQAVSYAGPPPTLLPFMLLFWIPADVLVLAFALASGVVAIWTLRRLELPLWWMLFPPIVAGLWVGNLNIFVMALLVAGGTFSGGLATVAKIYAVVPLALLFRWRAIAAAGAIMLLTVPLVPWPDFLVQYPRISASLAEQAWGGAQGSFANPLVTTGSAIGLVLLGRQRAAWLAVPVLWPATQLHYSVMALPGLVGAPLLGAFAAVNEPAVLGVGVMCYALWVRRDMVIAILSRRRRFSVK